MRSRCDHAWGAAAAGAMMCIALVVSGCGGGGGPPDQVPAPREEMVGTVTGGETTGPAEYAGEFAAKGDAGLLRVSNPQAGSLDYRISLVQLGPPYALRAILADDVDQVFVYTVAPAQGVANITPLTSLLVAQLYGESPEAIYDAFGANGTVDVARITDADMAAAQAQVSAYLAQELGLAVPESVGSFVTTPFKAQAGDAMYDTVVALAAKLQAQGRSFQSLSDDVAFAARLCLTEKIAITIGGAAADFCPQTKSATPRKGDETLIDHVFVDRRGNRLSLAVRADSLLSVRYDTEAGATYACSGTGCAGIALGALAADLTRSIAFDEAALQGAGGSVVLSGTLRSAVPGVVLPVLPCETNRFIVVGSDRSVVGQCADPDPFGFGVGGVPGGLIGVEVSRGIYDFSAPFGSDPTMAKVLVITDGYDGVLAVQFTDNEPDTYVPRRRFVCTFEACNGITLGPVTINTDFGGPDFPFYVRTIDFADTRLTGVNDDGTPNGLSATLEASLTPAYLLPVPPLAYPAPADCFEGLFPLAASAGVSHFNACVPPGQTAVNPETGLTELQASSVFESDDKLVIVLQGGAVASATLRLALVPGDFVCRAEGCAGLIVSAPDANGARTVNFDGAVFNEQFFGVAGPRTVTIDGSSLLFAAPVP